MSMQMILNSANATYLDSMYEAYLNDPDSVDPKWRDYFRSLAHDNADSTPALNASTLGQSRSQFAQKQTSVLNYISAVRYRGHRVAHLDPLGLFELPDVPDLHPDYHGLS